MDSKQTIFLHVFCFFPPAPHPPLQDCYVGHPLPFVLVLLCPPRQPDGMAERQGRQGFGHCVGLARALPPLCPSVPALKAAPAPTQFITLCVRICPQASSGVSVAATAASLSFLCVPLPSQAHPTLLLAPPEAASGFPSTALASLHPPFCSRTSRVACASVLFQAHLCSPKPHGL